MPLLQYPQLVLLGDSLFQHSTDTKEGFCFQGALQHHVIRRLDVVNRGFSGWNTSNVLQHLPDMFSPPSQTTPKIEYLLILLGANDAVRPLNNFSQHVPLKQYKQNLIDIITHPVIQAHSPKILLVTPPPVDEVFLKVWDIQKGWPDQTRFSALSAEYSQTARDVAASIQGVVLIDLWEAIMSRAEATTEGYKPGGPRLGTFEHGQRGALERLLPDGLHMGGEAYEVFFNAVKPHIGAEWADLPDDDRTGWVLPDWKTFGKAPTAEEN